MKLASMTVVTKSGVRYDANMITVGIEDHTAHPTLSFQCSARMFTLRADEVASIEYHEPGHDVTGYCQLCEQSLSGAPVRGPLG